MNKTKASIIGVIVLIVGAIVGFLSNTEAPITGSAVGTTFNSAKVAQINFSPATGSATTTSILNTDDSNRWVKRSFAFCTGVGTSYTAYTGAGLAALTFKVATTSTAAPALVTNTNYASDMTIATSSTFSAVSSSTINASAVANVWASGSYLTFIANATNTAACTVGVEYAGS